MGTLKVLYLTDKFLTYDVMHSTLSKYLKEIKIGIEPDYIQTDWPDYVFKYDERIREYVDVDDALFEKINDKDIIITHVAGIKEQHIKKANRLKIIGCTRSLPVNIDIKAAKEKGIAVIYSPGRSTEAVAEFTLGLMINIRRKIETARKMLKMGKWESEFFTYKKAAIPFKEQTVGIIGFGNIGRRVSELLKPFNCKILVYDPFITNKEISDIHGVKQVDKLDKLLEVSDIVTIHARTKDSKKEIIGEKELNCMKPTAYLINTARGYIINYNALYKFLKNGRLAGAALDTFDVEPLPPNHKLLSLDNVIATPHIAGATQETANFGIHSVCEGIYKILKNYKTRNII